MTDFEDHNRLDAASLEKISLITASVDSIDDFLNKPKLRKFSKSITKISSIMRKVRNQSRPPFDLISTVCSQTSIIRDEVNELSLLIDNVRARHDSIVDIHNSTIKSIREQSEISTETIRKIWEAKEKNKIVILFLAPYYNEVRLRDGYFRRIKSIDEIVGDNCLKIYVTPLSYMPENQPHQSFPDETHIDLKLVFENPGDAKLLKLIASMSDLIYYHSISFVNDTTLNVGNKQILDLHGSVPEEFAFLGNLEATKIEGVKEKKALEKVNQVIVVSEAMSRHLEKKYPSINFKHITLPVIDEQIIQIERYIEPKPLVNDKPYVVYVGGLQKWQMVQRMQQLVEKTDQIYNYLFLVPTPNDFLSYWKDTKTPQLCIRSGDRETVKEFCEKAHYGLLLREDMIVNRVSCPTKIIEYLAYGVVPVLLSTAIGDFIDLGMKFITLDALESGKLPTEEARQKLVKENYECLDRFAKLFQTGKSELLATLKNK